ncbi:MAG: metallophosphoesterase [Gemmobacter sp.]
MSAIRFVHITDLHVSAPEPADPGLASDTTETLRCVRGLIEAMDPAPAFVIASGDLTNRGDAASFRTLHGLMDGFGVPVIWALGNHDSRAGFRAVFGGDAADPEAPLDHEAVMAGVHIITLDTSRKGRIGGDLDAAQFDFLDAALGRHADLPKLLVIHHAPALDRAAEWEWEGLSFAATDRLAAMLPGRGVQGIFSGHIHMDRFTHWHGIPVVVGMGLHNALDPLYAGPGIRAVRGASLSVCTLRASGLTVTCAPLPSDRAELRIVTLEQLAAYEAAMAAAE